MLHGKIDVKLDDDDDDKYTYTIMLVSLLFPILINSALV